MVLLAVSVVSFLAAGALTVVALAGADTPEPCCAGPVAQADALPSPTTAPPATRAPALPQCLVGSWTTSDETLMVKFYTDVGKLPMTTSGRSYEVRANGTVVERNQNVQLVGNHNGTPIRLVINGTREFRWTATANTITYRSVTRTNLSWTYFDNRGELSTERDKPDPNFTETNSYRCEGGQVTESNSGGFHSVWKRTAGYGYYG
ncbi:hypothetical protein BLA60_17670 [Actinophytocola xinjiangensis]|uniref:Ig-like domain-containing protein n=1 Tax=Actinophytocola xinjiangensis TaxID=485602 RepID=A0A7Z0WLM6_9PSEU|nr:hypothetical protein BLA60_17670 [Actinophytocola xinjiangensis]